MLSVDPSVTSVVQGRGHAKTPLFSFGIGRRPMDSVSKRVFATGSDEYSSAETNEKLDPIG